MPVRRGRYFYWDSSIFTAYIGQEPGRVETIEVLWGQISSNGDNRIVTSMIAVAEVGFTVQEKARKILDQGVEQRIDDMWLDPSILLVETNLPIMKEARQLMRGLLSDRSTREWALRPYDAVHMATALWIHQNSHPIDVICTYDAKWYKFATILNIPIEAPRLIAPTQGLLPI